MTARQRHILQTLVDCRGDRTAACAALGIARSTLRQQLLAVRRWCGVRTTAGAVVAAWRAGVLVIGELEVVLD